MNVTLHGRRSFVDVVLLKVPRWEIILDHYGDMM